jgi:hypothetical protein
VVFEAFCAKKWRTDPVAELTFDEPDPGGTVGPATPARFMHLPNMFPRDLTKRPPPCEGAPSFRWPSPRLIEATEAGGPSGVRERNMGPSDCAVHARASASVRIVLPSHARHTRAVRMESACGRARLARPVDDSDDHEAGQVSRASSLESSPRWFHQSSGLSSPVGMVTRWNRLGRRGFGR